MIMLKKEKMGCRKIAEKDLQKLAELISCNELCKRRDISFDKSFLYEEKGNIEAFIITRPHSLYEFFGGCIPEEVISEEEKQEEHFEGDEFSFRNQINDYFPGISHYEILYVYPNYESDTLWECYRKIADQYTLVWTNAKNKYVADIFSLTDFNGEIFYDIPYVD